MVSDIQVKREVSPTPSESPQSLNLQRLNTRVRNQIEEKRNMVLALQAGVSSEGQKLFIAISKTIRDITWKGTDIVVFDEVIIRSPYKSENVHGDTQSGAYKHVKKVVIERTYSISNICLKVFIRIFHFNHFLIHLRLKSTLKIQQCKHNSGNNNKHKKRKQRNKLNFIKIITDDPMFGGHLMSEDKQRGEYGIFEIHLI